VAEYVDREAMIYALDSRDGYDDLVNTIREQPAADVQPVKHGYWEEVTDYGGWGDTHYRCSVCGEEWYLEDGKPKDNNMNFCPRCGARMDGDTND
jgi:DNA-directed RNA polymerase subunit RPC12/RpoP